MTTLLVLVQFMGQSIGLMYYRYVTPVEEQPQGWRTHLYDKHQLRALRACLSYFPNAPVRPHRRKYSYASRQRAARGGTDAPQSSCNVRR